MVLASHGIGLLPLVLLSLSKCFLSLSFQSSSSSSFSSSSSSSSSTLLLLLKSVTISFGSQLSSWCRRSFPWISADAPSWLDPSPKKGRPFPSSGALFGAETFDGSSQGESWGAVVILFWLDGLDVTVSLEIMTYYQDAATKLVSCWHIYLLLVSPASPACWMFRLAGW